MNWTSGCRLQPYPNIGPGCWDFSYEGLKFFSLLHTSTTVQNKGILHVAENSALAVRPHFVSVDFDMVSNEQNGLIMQEYISFGRILQHARLDRL